MEVEKTTVELKDLKRGGLILIDGVACRVDKVTITSSGKHGATKCRLDAIGLFDGRRKSIVKPSDETVEVPIIIKKTAQVLAIVGDNVQLMDMVDYSVFELPIPDEMKSKLQAGSEISYFEVMGIKTIKELK